MQIFVRTISEKTITLDISPDATVEDLKARIQDASGASPTEQRLRFKDKQLSDGSRLLSDFGIEKDCILHLFAGFPDVAPKA
mmetsp:Transcript_19732/g.35104  ORF Transcript_19732/g.35104 Transcript_19732/m.35104 type:complete len:82 (+) Transcript_19732:72-317(+)